MSWKSTTSPRGAAAGGRWRANQSVKVSGARVGSGRRRSMPATRSSIARVEGCRGQPVAHPRRPGLHPADLGDAPEQPVAQGKAVGLVVVVQELVLQLGHVHVGRALRLAPLALEAQVHHLVEAPARELGLRDFPRQHRAQGVGAAAGRVLLVVGDHVRGAHGALERLAAHADPVAHLDGRREPALLGEIEEGRGLPGAIRRPVAQVLGDGGAGHDVAGIQPVLRVEGPLQLAEGLHDGGPVHLLQIGAARAPVAVLAGDRPVELPHQVEDLVGDGLHLVQAARGLEIDDGADVQAAHRAVPVVGAHRVVLGEDLLEARHELGQVSGLDAGVLHEGDGLLVPLHAEEKAEPGLAELPDGLLLARIQGHGRRVAEALALAQRLQGLDLGAHLGLAVPRVLHDEDGLGIALHEAHALRRARGCRARGRGSSCPSARRRAVASRGWAGRTRGPPACRGSG